MGGGSAPKKFFIAAKRHYQDCKIIECGGDNIMESRSDIGRTTSRCVPDHIYISPIALKKAPPPLLEIDP